MASPHSTGAEHKHQLPTDVTVDVHGNARKGAKQYQEDSFCYVMSARKRACITAVFDGHGGYNGMIASQTARDMVLSYFESVSEACEIWSPQEWSQQLSALFRRIHDGVRDKFMADGAHAAISDPSQRRHVDEKGIVRNHAGDPIHGGATGTMVVMVSNPDGTADIISANVGDSAALMFFPNSQAGDEPYTFLTVVS